MDAQEIRSKRILLYTDTQIRGVVAEQSSRYRAVVDAVRESGDLALKLETLSVLVGLRIEFGRMAEISMAIRTYCNDLGLGLEDGKGAIDDVVKHFRVMLDAKWPFDP